MGSNAPVSMTHTQLPHISTQYTVPEVPDVEMEKIRLTVLATPAVQDATLMHQQTFLTINFKCKCKPKDSLPFSMNGKTHLAHRICPPHSLHKGLQLFYLFLQPPSTAVTLGHHMLDQKHRWTVLHILSGYCSARPWEQLWELSQVFCLPCPHWSQHLCPTSLKIV